MELPRPIVIDPGRPEETRQIVDLLPETRGVYLFSAAGRTPHIGSTLHLRRRLNRLLLLSYTGASQHGMADYLRTFREVACWAAGSRLEVSLLLHRLTRRHFPQDYLKRLRLRLPWFLEMQGGDGFPLLDVQNRLRRGTLAAYGPFLSREAAQRYEQNVLGLFQLRRCTETLLPGPEHPGCIYGEMNQCARPCQCAVSADEYGTEASRVLEFLDSNGRSALAALTGAREQAAADLDFEQAAQLHKRWEKVTAAAGVRDAVIAPLEAMHGVALTRGIAPLEFRLWPMWKGHWQGAVTITVSTLEQTARSLDQEVRGRLAAAFETPSESTKRDEDLAIFSRWYYSSWRDGQWFGFRHFGELNVRKMVRAISAMSRE